MCHPKWVCTIHFKINVVLIKHLLSNGLVANAELSCNKNFSCVHKGANNIYLPMFEWKFKMTTKDIYLILKVPFYA